MSTSLAELERRVALIEPQVQNLTNQDTIYRLTISALEKADSATAAAVDALSRTINDPELGLIVQLRLFRDEVKLDRVAFRAWVRGATAVLGIIIAIVTIASPWIRVFVESALHVTPVN